MLHSLVYGKRSQFNELIIKFIEVFEKSTEDCNFHLLSSHNEELTPGNILQCNMLDLLIHLTKRDLINSIFLRCLVAYSLLKYMPEILQKFQYLFNKHNFFSCFYKS